MSELPSSWMPARIGDLIELNPKNILRDETTVGFVPMPLLGKGYRDKVKYESRPWSEIKKGYTHFRDGDVLLAKITPCFENGKAGLVRDLPSGAGAGSTEYFVSRAKPNVLDSRYLLAYFKTEDFVRNGALQMTGSVGHKRVPKEHITESRIPLAPFNEQKRIADKLDAVLARVDTCRDRLDRIPAILKRFRQSVLAAATSGKLTEDWRLQNPDVPGKATSEVQQGIEHRKAKHPSNKKFKVPVKPDLSHWTTEVPDTWSIESVSAFAECLDHLRVPVTKDQRSSVKGLYPYYGANGQVDMVDEFLFDDELVLVTEDETFYGREKPIAYRSSGKCWVNNHAHVLLTGDRHRADYLCFALMYYNVIPWLTGTTGRAKLTQGVLNTLPIAVPPQAELVEIVRRVESLFALADQLEARYTVARTHTERLTPALLSKAFRGELVPQDPADEPAAALLTRLQTASALNVKVAGHATQKVYSKGTRATRA